MLPSCRCGSSRSALSWRARSCAAGLFLAVAITSPIAIPADLPQVLTGINAKFTGAQLPVVTGGNMVINQVADKATLHWQSFDIAAGNSVEFRQPSTSAVALNRIFDGKPSEIRGRLSANGQVYLINANGVVFGAGAEVNTQSLVASTLDIDDRIYEQVGFVNAINDSTGVQPAFDSFGRPMGEIHIEPGAKLESAVGGRILIFAPRVVNEGEVRTPEGQQVLAGVEDKVLIAASDNPDLRGILVEVATGGEVTNLGSLIAERGNVSLIGMAVNQDGLVRATTSVSLNGSVRLLARDMNGTLNLLNDEQRPFKPQAVRGGDVTLGAGSVTEVVPDRSINDKGEETRAADAQSQPLSRIDIAGTRVHLGTGSRVTATGGAIALGAGADPGETPRLDQPGDPATVAASLVIGSGAVVDASGDDTTRVPVTRNVVTVEARGNELADSPVQRTGPIRNKKLQVDLRTGTGFLNIAGAVASITRTAAERQSPGGSISMLSEGALVLSPGARLDVSGGQVAYTEGIISTSRLRQVNGRIVEIANADPDQTYTGLVDNLIRREAGYIEGRDAGTLTLQARGLTLDGVVSAGVTIGTYQRNRSLDLDATTPVVARPFDQLPRAGSFSLTWWRSGFPDLVLGTAAGSAAAVPPLVLSPQLLASSGAGQIDLINNGPVLVNADVTLPAWSGITLDGTRVDMAGNLRIPGGTLRIKSGRTVLGGGLLDEDLLTAIDGVIDLGGRWITDNPLLLRAPPTDPLAIDGGTLDVRSGSSILVSQRSRLDVDAGAWRRADGRVNGGRGGAISLATGSLQNVQAGARLDVAGELRGFGFSSGGSLAVSVERARVVPQPGSNAGDDLLLDGRRQFGLAGQEDGAGNRQYVLEIGAGTFQQGGFGSYRVSVNRADLAVASGSALQLRTAALVLGGTATALAPGGTALDALASPAFAPLFQRAPVKLQLTSTNKLANAIGAVAELLIGAGSRIVADPGSEIRLRSNSSLFVDGVIEAPGGVIDIAIENLTEQESNPFVPAQAIRLGSGAQLRADGVALIDDLDPRGLRRGEVLPGGRVNLRTDQGSLLAESQALISADGALGDLDLGAGIPQRRRVASAAGSIGLSAAESLLFKGALSAAAPAGFDVEGGRLGVSLDTSRRNVLPLIAVDGIPRGPHTLVMQDFTGELPAPGEPVDPAEYATGYVPLSRIASGGFDALDITVRSSAVNRGTPDTYDALPVISFPGDLDLRLDRSLRLDAAVLATVAAQVHLEAPYVGIGHGDTRLRFDGTVPSRISASDPRVATLPIRLTPTAGDGVLDIGADLIELIGETVTRGFGNTGPDAAGITLHAREDIRARGVRQTLREDYRGLLRTAGHLALDAARVYPTTLTGFEIGVEGAEGRLSFAGGGGSGPPGSIGGTLDVSAEQIVQGGALFAPLGELRLTATSSLVFSAGSLTSTTAAGVSAPFFRTEPGGSLIIPAPTILAGTVENQVVFTDSVTNAETERRYPRQLIELQAPVVNLDAGARFDVRGGTEAAATEFVPGPGGSRDILLADLAAGDAVEANASFAIMPGLGSFAPYDPLESPDAGAVQGIRIGDTLLLEDGLPGLPAGEYAILPARYALFGGFLVTPAGQPDLASGARLQRDDGAPILAGRFAVAGNGAADSRSQGFAVEDGERVRRRAEYLQTPLRDLYGDDARGPDDAGSLVIDADDELSLRGELVRAGVAPGRGSAVDIATNAAINVVDEILGTGDIELRTDDLRNLGADSLLLGGRRASEDGAERIVSTSTAVTIVPGVVLDMPELLLAADRVEVLAGPDRPTRLVSSAGAGGPAVLRSGDGAALVAVSNRRLELQREASGSASALRVEEGVALEARGGLVLDATGDVTVAGDLAAAGGSIGLGAARISLGDTDGRSIDEGLVLSNADLAAIAGSDLRLASRGLIDLYGRIANPLSPTQPLRFGSLALDAQAIQGLDDADGVTSLEAGALTIANTSGATFSGTFVAAGANSGLQLTATGDITIGAGTLAIGGYGLSRLEAGTALVIEGAGIVDATGDLAIDAPLITANQSASARLRATGAVTVGGAGPAGGTLAPAAGAGIAIEGEEVDFGGRIDLPSGVVRIDGGSIRLRGEAVIDVSGRALTFGPKNVGTPGGVIALSAGAGDLQIDSGAVLDVSAAGVDPEAGELALNAPGGALRFGSGVQLRGVDADGMTGRLSIDAGTLAGDAPGATDGVGALTQLIAGGFHDSVSLRLRQQPITLAAGARIDSRQIRLVSDSATVEIAGTLDASGILPGRIWLAAGDDLDVSGAIEARGVDRGGRVDLYALDSDGDDAAGLVDVVNLRDGAVIDVSGAAGGEVFVHTRRLDSNADNKTDRLLAGVLEAVVTGASRAELVATRVLRDPGATLVADPGTGTLVKRVTITSGTIGAWRSETEQFLAGKPTALGGLTISAGLQVEGTGDIVLRDAWDFSDGWYFGRDLSDPLDPQPGRTGILTLRAARNLDLQADLTDAFSTQYLFGFLPYDALNPALDRLDAEGDVVGQVLPKAWGYRLAAGSDLTSADVLATGTSAALLQLGANVRVRTGTADIDIASSDDVRLRNGAALYSAGLDRGLSADLEEAVKGSTEPFFLRAYDYIGTFLNGGLFPDRGGSVTVRAGGDLRADTAPGATGAWLTRIGSAEINDSITLYSSTEGYGAMPTHWSVVFGEFRNAVGAFGGGSLDLTLGGSASDLLLAAPTTGRAVAGVEALANEFQLLFQPSGRSTEIIGGGRIDLLARGDLGGGQLVLGRGSARLRTRGSTGSTSAPQVFLGGDARLDWVAGRSLRLAGLQDPTVAPLDASQLTAMSQVFSNIDSTGDFANRFYTYDDESRVRLGALGGDLGFAQGAGFSGYLPPRLTAVAFGGDLNVEPSPLSLFPSARGQVELLARDDLVGNFVASARLRQSDEDRSFLASVDQPNLLTDAAPRSRVPVHTGDAQSNLVIALTGSVKSGTQASGFWSLEFAKPTIIQAGTDISNLGVRIQHIAADALSSFQAGRDIVQGVLRENDGRFKANDARIFEIWGPGSAEFIAGRDIALGTSACIESIGNTKNPALATDGASLRLLAGTGGEAAWDRFTDVYVGSAPSADRDAINAFLADIDAGRAGFKTSSDKTSLAIGPGEYLDELQAFLARYGVDPQGADPVAVFRTLSPVRQREFLFDVLLDEIGEWGAATVTGDRADVLNFVRGYVALDAVFRSGEVVANGIDAKAAVRDFLDAPTEAVEEAQKNLFGTLFPQTAPRGDLSLLLSQVQTIAGGNLSILAPGGNINAGAADADVIDKKPEDLGIVTGRGGDIRIAVDGDLLVNSTRVTALRGDVLAWSSNGNIDAGRGSKTVTSVPDPIVSFDADGNTVITFPPAIAGSGVNGVNAALFAPRGEVNAGDAGIQTSGNLIIGAVEVVGADNIAVGGVEIGFSTSDVVAVVPPGASSASSAATRGMSTQASMSGSDEAGAGDGPGEAKIAFITVEVLSFGDGEDGEE